MSNINSPVQNPSNPSNQLASQLYSLSSHILRDTKKSELATGLTPERLSILSILVSLGSKTVNELAEMEQVSAPAITRIVKSLEKDGYVIKAKSRADQRVVFVSATRKSKALLQQVTEQSIDQLGSKIEMLSTQEIKTLSSLLERLLKGFAG